MMLGADEIRAQHFDVPGFFTIYTRYCQALRARGRWTTTTR